MTSGPSASFDALVAAHGREVARLCGALLRDPHLAADASQETFLRLWRRMAAGRAPASAGGWLRRVALSSALDLLRRRRAGAPLAQAPEAVEQAAGSLRAPEALAELRELEQRFEAALGALPEGQRTVFLLRHASGLSLAEVAEMLGLALPTVKTHFARAALKLQARLSAFRDEPARASEPRDPPEGRIEP